MLFSSLFDSIYMHYYRNLYVTQFKFLQNTSKCIYHTHAMPTLSRIKFKLHLAV